MAETILINVLNATISVDELFKWLTSDNLEDTISTDIVQNESTRTEFLSYFLNYLREQSKSILADSKDVQLLKKGINESHKAGLPSSGETSTRHPKVSSDHVDSLQESNEPRIFCNDNQSPLHAHPVRYPGIPPSPGHATEPVHGQMQAPMHVNRQSAGQVGNMSPRTGNPTNARSPVHRAYSPQSPYQSYSMDSSWPLPNNKACATQSPLPTHCSVGSQHSPNQFYGNSNTTTDPRYPGSNYPGDGKHVGIASTPNPSPNVSNYSFNNSMNQTQMEMGRINISGSYGASVESGFDKKFQNSMTNGISNAPFSPLSPLYANNVSTLCPRSIEKLANETSNSPNYSGTSANSSRASTPKGTPGSGQKNVKPGQNQNRNFGDFMNVDSGQGPKKSSKKQSKIEQGRKSQAKTDLSADKKKSSAKAEKSKRRINPTRLDVSYDKERPGQEVFGTISRPKAANPKFVEAPSTDRTQEGASFEVERELLKLERQKQPKIESITDTANVEQKLSVKSEPKSTVVPRVDLVKNVDVLNALANIYSGILHRNLMTNPMTELYFLVTLLTAHYKTSRNKESTEIVANDDKTISSVELKHSLDDDLGCAEITAESDCENTFELDRNSRDSSIDDETEKSSLFDDSTNPSKNTNAKSETNNEGYLDTPHNCVYFATMVMVNQRFLLSALDRATLKLLCENHQINAFQPELKTHLSELYGIKCSQATSIKPMDSKNLQTNVCFQVETDNRETFPSSTAFDLFRKQRDLFYDILREWEDNHLKPDWSFQKSLRSKIDFLLNLHTDAVNYCHFAKLFVSQLIVSSMQIGHPEDPMNDDSLSFLMSLKNVNPEKLIQLKERLVTPLTSTGPVPEPTFPGVQEFYKKFILSVCDWKFHVILQTNFIHEIMELNEAQFAGIEIEGEETTANESTRHSYITCLSSLRLLAKFASFTVSLPFNTSASSPEWVLSQIKLRQKIVPPLDLRDCLMGAFINRRLSLTIPWIVQYLSMLDTVTLRLPYYVDISERLYCIYRISSQLCASDFMTPQTAILMMFTIGWLFELPNFPRDIHALWQTNYDEKKWQLLGSSNDERANGRAVKTLVSKNSEEFVKGNSSLDKLDIVDDRALHECCPFLTEFKILLISGNAVIGNANPNRHITPVSCQLSQQNSAAKMKNLQIQLEEAFLNGQSSSIRKTINFVSERVASSCVKYICNSIIPSTKQRKMNEFINSKNHIIAAIKREEKSQGTPEKGTSTNETQSRSELVDRPIAPLATIIVEAVKKECDDKMSKMCEERIVKSFESLLADDAYPSVRETCAAIAQTTAVHRIYEWIELHVTESLFMKTLIFDLRRLMKVGDVDQAVKQNRHNPDAPCPTKTIEMIRNFMWELMEKRGRWGKLDFKRVKNTLTCLRQTLTEREDLVVYPEKNLYVMSVEFCLLLLAKRPNLFTPDVQQRFINVWKLNKTSRSSDTEGLFVRIISPRNIRLLTDTAEKTVFKTFGRLLKGLLKDELLTIGSLSNQWVALFRQEWSETTLKQLSQCLNEVLADYKSSSVHAETMKNLLVWIASTCDEMEVLDYD